MRFTLYRSDCLEVPENCTYLHKVEVTGKDSLIEAVKHDYVVPSIRATTVATTISSAPTACRSIAITTTATIRKNGSIPQTSLQLSPVLPLRFITAAIT